MNIKELREKARKIEHEARELLKKNEENYSAEVDAQFDKMLTEADGYTERANKLEALEQRDRIANEIVTQIPEQRESRSDERDEKAEFRSYLRGENRAMSIANDDGTKGGVLVPTEVMSEIVAAMADYGPFNEGGPARLMVTASGGPINVPTSDNTAGTASVKAENAAAGEKDHIIDEVTITVDTYDSGLFPLSNEFIRDANTDVVRFVIDQCAENLGRKANEVHTTNLLAGASAGITAAAVDGITGDELLDVAYAVNSAYRRKGGFMFNSQTELAIRKLKDGQNNYLWQPSYAADKPNTVAGFSYWTNDDMPDLAAGAKAIAFGDYSQFYIRRVGGVEVKRSDDLLMASNATAFIGFMSTGSAVVRPTAIKYITQAAA